jgi:hypothetical protein
MFSGGSLGLFIGGTAMPDPVDVLILDLLEWIGGDGRPYQEVMEAWRTSCPRLPIWEEANDRGFITRSWRGSEAMVFVSESGTKFLTRYRTVGQATPAKNSNQCQA